MRRFKRVLPYANTMSRHLGSNSRHNAPGTFRVVLGQVQLLLHCALTVSQIKRKRLSCV